MKVKGIVTIIFIVIIMLMSAILNPSVVKADNVTVEDIKGGVGNFMNAGKTQNNPLNQEGLQNVSDVVYNVLLAVGIIAAVIVGLIIGIKYMMGSVAQKAETKELLAPYIVGCVIIFGAFAIWKIVVDLLNQTQV